MEVLCTPAGPQAGKAGVETAVGGERKWSLAVTQHDFLLWKQLTPCQSFVLMLHFVSALEFSAVLTEVTEEGGAPGSPLNFAEEMKLLTSLGKMEINMFDSFYCRHVRAFYLSFCVGGKQNLNVDIFLMCMMSWHVGTTNERWSRWSHKVDLCFLPAGRWRYWEATGSPESNCRCSTSKVKHKTLFHVDIPFGLHFHSVFAAVSAARRGSSVTVSRLSRDPANRSWLKTWTSSQAVSRELKAWLVVWIFCFIYSVHSCRHRSGPHQSFVTHSSVCEKKSFNAGRGIFSDVGTYCKIEQRSMFFLTISDLTIYRGFYVLVQRYFWNFNYHFVAARGCAAGEKRRQDRSQPVQR